MVVAEQGSWWLTLVVLNVKGKVGGREKERWMGREPEKGLL